MQGVNVSYDNSFTAIKHDIKSTVDKHHEMADKIKRDAGMKPSIPKPCSSKRSEEIKDEEGDEMHNETPNKPKSIDFSMGDSKNAPRTIDT